MKVCFPVKENEGISSKVFGHFGSAPIFMIVDTESNKVEEVINRDVKHEHGKCSPLKALGGHVVDAVVVGGIGGGAFNGLARVGIAVYKSAAERISENIALLNTQDLALWQSTDLCSSHGHGSDGGCAH